MRYGSFTEYFLRNTEEEEDRNNEFEIIFHSYAIIMDIQSEIGGRETSMAYYVSIYVFVDLRGSRFFVYSFFFVLSPEAIDKVERKGEIEYLNLLIDFI